MQLHIVFHLYHSPKEVFEGPYVTHTSLIQKLQSLMFGFVIKKDLLQLQQNSPCVQGIIPYTVVKPTGFFPRDPLFRC